MITIPNCSHFLKFNKVNPSRFESRHRIRNRALVIDLTEPCKMLENQGQWLNSHAIPHDGSRDVQIHYSSSFVAKSGAHIGLVKAGFQARTFCFPCDGRIFFWQNQLQDKFGNFLTVNVARTLFNTHHHKLRMESAAYKGVFWEIQALCGEKSGPVADQINHEAAARANANAVKRSAMFDFSSQAGDNVGQIVKPCIMVAESALCRDYEPSAFGLEELPRYYDQETNKVIIVPGGTKGQIVKITPPFYATRGSQVYSHIIPAVLEGHKLFLMGAMPVQRYLELTAKTRVLLQFRPDQEPTWWRIMPLASAHWMPMIDFLQGLNGFEEAVATGLLLLEK